MKIVFYPFVVDRDWGLAIQKLGIRFVEDTKGIIAVDEREKKVVAGCIMNNWTYSSVQVHFWIDKPMVLRHGFLEEIARYVFDVAHKDLMIGLVPADNEEALKLDKHIGFKETHRIKGGYMYDIDYVIMEARREDVLRWLPVKEEAA